MPFARRAAGEKQGRRPARQDGRKDVGKESHAGTTERNRSECSEGPLGEAEAGRRVGAGEDEDRELSDVRKRVEREFQQ